MNNFIEALMRYLPLWALHRVVKLGGHFRVAANDERYRRLPPDRQEQVLKELYEEGKLEAHRAVTAHGMEKVMTNLINVASQPQSRGVQEMLRGARDYLANRIKEKS